MAWMLLVGALENLQQELVIEIRTRTRTGKQALRRSSRISLFAKILGNRGVSIKQEDYKISFYHAPRLKMTLILILFIALVRVVVAGIK
jgi:hypothetical protein